MGRVHLDGAALSAPRGGRSRSSTPPGARGDRPARLRDVDELLAAGGFDAALIAAPTDLHPALVAAVAGAGVPILCEKPCGLDRGWTPRRRPPRRGVVLQVGYWRRFVAELVALRGSCSTARSAQPSSCLAPVGRAAAAGTDFRARSGGIAVDMARATRSTRSAGCSARSSATSPPSRHPPRRRRRRATPTSPSPARAVGRHGGHDHARPPLPAGRLVLARAVRRRRARAARVHGAPSRTCSPPRSPPRPTRSPPPSRARRSRARRRADAVAALRVAERIREELRHAYVWPSFPRRRSRPAARWCSPRATGCGCAPPPARSTWT